VTECTGVLLPALSICEPAPLTPEAAASVAALAETKELSELCCASSAGELLQAMAKKLTGSSLPMKCMGWYLHRSARSRPR
jgi:hypothetical protein